VLPRLAAKGLLHTYLHTGFWKSMDTSKDQQELEGLCVNGVGPWEKVADLSPVRQLAAVQGD